MQHDWIIDVLSDLKSFASANELDALAVQLDEAKLVAQIELATGVKGSGIGLCVGDARSGRASGTA